MVFVTPVGKSTTHLAFNEFNFMHYDHTSYSKRRRHELLRHGWGVVQSGMFFFSNMWFAICIILRSEVWDRLKELERNCATKSPDRCNTHEPLGRTVIECT